MSSSSEQIAQHLVDIEAVSLNLESPFTWASGMKSPIYCDNRKVLSYPEVREIFESEMSNYICQTFEDCELIAGGAT